MIFLHIGINKTGSSSIQHALHDNRDALRCEGVLYPETGLGSRRNGYGYHFQLARALGFSTTRDDQIDHMAAAESLRAAFDREVAMARPKAVFLSNEHFTQRRDMEPVRRFLQGLDVRVVVYLRRHDDWYPSLYAQALKSVAKPPWKSGLEGYVDWVQSSNPAIRYQSFGQLLDAWADVVGQENVLVRPFERGSMKDDLIEDFFDLCGLPVPAALAGRPAPQVNRAVDASMLGHLERIKRAPIGAGAKRFAVRTVSRLARSGRKAGMPPELKERLLRMHAEDYARIARDYLHDPSGVLFRQTD